IQNDPVGQLAKDGKWFEMKEEGTLNITKLDTISKSISGTFQFTVQNNSGIKVTVSEGKFNHSYILRN
ncbi:MAG: hypothetical protein V4642_08700, partial [Bacteroidota bacterium]